MSISDKLGLKEAIEKNYKFPELKKDVKINNEMAKPVSEKYKKNNSEVFYLNEVIHNIRNLKLFTKIKFNHAKRVDALITKDQISYCRKIHHDMNKSNGVSQKTYKKKDYDFGRYYYESSLGLQSINGKIRRLLCDNNVFELDLVNSHIKLLINIIKDFNVSNCLQILDYDIKRDNYLLEIQAKYKVNRNVAKELFLILSYGGTFQTWIKHNNLSKTFKPVDFIKSFQNDIKKIIGKLSQDCDYYQTIISIRDKIKPKDVKEKKLYSSLALFLQDLETNIMVEVMKYLNEYKINTECFIHDGILVSSKFDEIINDKFIENICEHIKNKLGFDILLKKKLVKPTDEDNKWLNDIEKLIDNKDDYHIVETDKEGADFILEKYLDNSIYRSNGVIFVKEDNCWKAFNKKEDVNWFIGRVISNIDIRLSDEDGNVKQYSAMSNGISNLTKLVFLNIPEFKDFNEFTITSTKNKLCFLDGVYDCITKKFTEWEFVNNVYTQIIINRNFPNDVNDEDIDIVNNKIWYSMFNDVDDVRFLKQQFARAILSGNLDKRWLMMMGRRDCGKSVLIKFFEKAFGDYIGTTTSENLHLHNNENSTDPAKKNIWICSIWNKRIVFTSELQQGTMLDGVKIKSTCSGCTDKLDMRLNYQDPQKLIPQFLLCILANDIADVKPEDTKEKLVFSKNDFKFVSEEEMLNPKNYYKLRDINIDTFISNEIYMNAFVKDILDNYIYEVPKFSRNIELITQSEKDVDNPLDMICDKYEITGNNEDCELLNEFRNNMKKLKLSSVKLIDIMKEEHPNIYKLKNNTKKKIYIHGIKKKSHIDSDDDA